jgi:GMP synthase PP-ATPase subunit
LGEVTPERVEIARRADHIFISMIREAGLYDKIAQAYAALDPSKAVGVMVCSSHFSGRSFCSQLTLSNAVAERANSRGQGDKRVYAEIIILRAVETTDCNPTPLKYILDFTCTDEDISHDRKSFPLRQRVLEQMCDQNYQRGPWW